jgi:hypothetical protein
MGIVFVCEQQTFSKLLAPVKLSEILPPLWDSKRHWYS